MKELRKSCKETAIQMRLERVYVAEVVILWHPEIWPVIVKKLKQ
jgi:hypothetical protein